MGRIVFAAAMSHVLDPDYYGRNVGPHGRQAVETLMGHVAEMGRTAAARRPDALMIVADDHLNVFSFNAVPAFCVRIGTSVERMQQKEAVAFDKLLDRLPRRYPLHEALANRVLEEGIEDGFDLASSWEAPLDHAFLSPATEMFPHDMPPLAPIWVNCFVSPQPTARRCFALGQHIGRVIARSPWNVALIATGAMSHFPELKLSLVGTSDTPFDRKVLGWLEAGDHDSLKALTIGELHRAGEHELLNWIVVAGAVSPARAKVRFFGELGRTNLAAVEWETA
jgi:2,3-dihydroxyphenylpropionate 1,2-dioxygenase